MKMFKENVVEVEKVTEVKVEDVAGEGLEFLLGKQVILFCVNYFYAGKLVGVNDKFVLLEDGGIVYETGQFTAEKWKDFHKVNKKLYVMTAAIESFCEGKPTA